MKLFCKVILIYAVIIASFAKADIHNNDSEVGRRQTSIAVPRHRIEDPSSVEFKKAEIHFSNITHIRLFVNGEYIQLLTCSFGGYADHLIKLFNERKQQAIKEKKYLWIDIEHTNCFVTKDVQRDVVRVEKVPN